MNKELATLKSELSGLRTEFNNKLRTCLDFKLANTQEKLQKVETKQLSTDKYIETLKQILPPDDSLVLLSAFKKKFYALRTDFNTTIQKVEVRSVKNQIELYNIREKLKKVDAKQLSTDDLHLLMPNLPPENDSYVLHSFFDPIQKSQIDVNHAIGKLEDRILARPLC